MHKPAFRLLTLLSFLGPDPIPLRLFYTERRRPYRNPLLDQFGHRSIFSIFLCPRQEPSADQLDAYLQLLVRCGAVSREDDCIQVQAEMRIGIREGTEPDWRRRMCRAAIGILTRKLSCDLELDLVSNPILSHAECVASDLVHLFNSPDVVDDSLQMSIVLFTEVVQQAEDFVRNGGHGPALAAPNHQGLSHTLRPSSTQNQLPS